MFSKTKQKLLQPLNSKYQNKSNALVEKKLVTPRGDKNYFIKVFEKRDTEIN